MRNALAAIVALVVAGCLNAGPGACTPEAAAAFKEIEHYGGISLEPQDYPLGGRCVGSFTSDDDPEVVLEFYRTQWTAAGWSLDPPLFGSFEGSPFSTSGPMVFDPFDASPFELC